MRWFKHSTEMLSDPFVVALCESAGKGRYLEGYALYNGILEHCTGLWNPGDVSKAVEPNEHPLPVIEVDVAALARKLRVKKSRLARFISTVINSGKIILYDCADDKISDNLAKISDNLKGDSGTTERLRDAGFYETSIDLIMRCRKTRKNHIVIVWPKMAEYKDEYVARQMKNNREMSRVNYPGYRDNSELVNGQVFGVGAPKKRINIIIGGDEIEIEDLTKEEFAELPSADKRRALEILGRMKAIDGRKLDIEQEMEAYAMHKELVDMRQKNGRNDN